MTINLLNGDCAEQLKTIPSDSVDLILTDPPYGYEFMGRDWDKGVPPVSIWRECLRVLKPGTFAFVMSAPRQDVLSQMIVRLGQAGFSMEYSSIYWAYAKGMPKGMNIGKAIDKSLGLKRSGIIKTDGKATDSGSGCYSMNDGACTLKKVYETGKPMSVQAQRMEGSYAGFQPKPAVEIIIVAMKPLSAAGYLDQAKKDGKGVTWMDDCKIPLDGTERMNAVQNGNIYGKNEIYGKAEQKEITPTYKPEGRFPANLLVSDGVLDQGLDGFSKHFDLDRWAARKEIKERFPFMVCPKASDQERDVGCEHLQDRNCHLTVKPLKLMLWLATLGSRTGETVLDPYMGSGTTGIAAKATGRNFIGIEIDPEYYKVATQRVNNTYMV